MGNLMVHNFIKAGLSRKRKASIFDSEHDYNEETSDPDLYELNSKECVQRKKEAKTSKYIYKTLFEEQQGSDVTITAFGRTWNLHKLYISQSPYFYTMFNGDWLETQKKEIELIIEDENVTPEALNKVFSSFYQDEIEIDPIESVSIIGAASLLQMDHLCQQCVQVMKRNVNINSVISYFENAEFYSLKTLKELSFDWLLQNLLYKVHQSPSHLRKISCDLMTSLIKSPDLIVIQTEFSIYLLLKQWVFLRESDCVLSEGMEIDKLADDYFKNSYTMPFLMSEKGEKYKKAFFALRLRNLISHSLDLTIIERDNIIPGDWLAPIFRQQWQHMLKIEEGSDTGPIGINEEIFHQYCSRMGRVIKHDRETNWRWTGFNYGLDLVVNYSRGTVSLSRVQDTSNLRQHYEYRTLMELMYKDKKRHIMYCIGVYSLDKNGKVYRKQKTGLKSIILEFGKQKSVMTFECDMKFPILFSANFLVTSPPDIANENKLQETTSSVK